VSYAEFPADTDAEKILHGLEDLRNKFDAIVLRLDQQRDGINNIGENLQWLVQNTQGIFAMINSPQFMKQMPGALMGGFNASNSGPEPAAAGTGEDAGTG
jgi:hypothetical protein